MKKYILVLFISMNAYAAGDLSHVQCQPGFRCPPGQWGADLDSDPDVFTAHGQACTGPWTDQGQDLLEGAESEATQMAQNICGATTVVQVSGFTSANQRIGGSHCVTAVANFKCE